MKPFIHYITHWYRNSNDNRMSEMLYSVAMQLSSPYILSTSILSMDDQLSIPSILINRRPTYSEMLMFSKTNLDTVNLLINTDCYIEPEDVYLLSNISENEVWCISRQDLIHRESQDAWVWRGTLNLPNLSFTMGVPGCDNRFAFECASLNRIVSNPSLSIRVNHIHKTNIRSYSQENRVSNPYLFIEPSKINEPALKYFRGNHSDMNKLKIEGLLNG